MHAHTEYCQQLYQRTLQPKGAHAYLSNDSLCLLLADDTMRPFPEGSATCNQYGLEYGVRYRTATNMSVFVNSVRTSLHLGL